MLLRDSMWVILNPRSSKPALLASCLEWFAFGVVLCLAIGLLDNGSRILALIAGLLTGAGGVAVLLLLRKLIVKSKE